MSSSSSILAIIIGLVCLVAGSMIRFRNMPQLMIGYNPNRIANKEGYAGWTGLNVILIGLVLIAAGLVRAFLPAATATTASTIFMFVLFVLIVLMFYGSKRFEGQS